MQQVVIVESVGIDQLSRARVLEKICDQKRDQTSFVRLRATGQTSVSKIVGSGVGNIQDQLLLVPVVDALETPSLLQSRNSLEKFVRSAHGILPLPRSKLGPKLGPRPVSNWDPI